MLDQSVTRVVFEGLGAAQELFFYVLAAVATAVFLAGLLLKARKYLRGRREDRFGSPVAFARGALQGIFEAASNRTIAKRDTYAGVFHAAVMWGFVVLFIGTVILTIDTDIVGVFAPQAHFFWGPFYVVYSLVLDVLGLALLIGVTALAVRRYRFHKPQLDYRRVDLGEATTDRGAFVRGDWIFLAWLFVLGVTGFLVEAVRIVAHDYPWFEVFSPVGWTVAWVLGALGLSAGAAGGLHLGLWWFHAVIALAFIAYLPFAKAFHMLADGADLILRSPLAGRRLPVLPGAGVPPALAALAPVTASDGHVGLRDLADFSWKQLLDFDSCTKCGRCHVACPAVTSGAPLSPRDLILDLRQQADGAWAILAPGHERRSDLVYGVGGAAPEVEVAAGAAGNGHAGGGPAGNGGHGNGAHANGASGGGDVPGQAAGGDGQAAAGLAPPFTFPEQPSLGIAPKVGDGGVVAGGVIRTETLWSCTTCLACVEACPVGIEHVPAIVGMRRSLVDRGLVEPGLQAAFTNLAKQGNSFGLSGRARGRWTEGLPVPIRDARKDAVEWLWFVGDFASFDQRVAEATRLVARVFQEAGVDFGILYEGERNAGNDIRRAGEEGLFEMLAEHNVGQLSRVRFRRIVTTDPHTLNTLRFEYPQFGGEYSVWHYSELLTWLFRQGRLQRRAPVARRVTYHDPCYLARYSEVTLAPREVLEAVGAELVEMPRNGLNTFCCGAGGGRIWMDDSGLRERPSENRIREAAALEGVTDFVTACPKDLTMYTAAVKATGHEERLAVRDLVELVALAIDLPGDGGAGSGEAPAERPAITAGATA